MVDSFSRPPGRDLTLAGSFRRPPRRERAALGSFPRPPGRRRVVPGSFFPLLLRLSSLLLNRRGQR